MARDGVATRREMLVRSGGGFGALAAAHLLAAEGAFAAAPRPEFNGGLHHPAKVRRVIQLFMNGGASQMDTFDYKPELERRHGEQVEFGIKAAATSTPGAIMKSPFEWRQHGETGRWVTSVFPKIAEQVDSLAFLMSMTSPTNVHGPASYLHNTGFLAPGFPCMGAWLSYGLGRLTDELPSFVVMPDPRGLPYNNAGNFTAGFLPAAHHATIIKPADPTPIAYLDRPEGACITAASERDGLDLLARLNQRHLAEHPGDSRLAARIEAFELAAKLQSSAPAALSLADETSATQALYGVDDEHCGPFAKNCLIARRMIERGVRFVQVWSGTGGASKNWDNHSDIVNELPFIASMVDQPIAGLLVDLQRRGLMEDTLVIWTSEFGRMPFTQGATGRDHNGGTFVTWLAGAGVRAGVSYGESDEFSYKSAVNPTPVWDLHATVLHLLGINHEQLTFRHNGIDRRLTDVHGHVIHDVLA